MEDPEDVTNWRQSLDPYQKYRLLDEFYQQSLFPFLDRLHTGVSIAWQGLAEQITYECQFNHREFLTVTNPSELHELFIRFGQTNADELLEVQMLVQLSLKPEFRHPNGTGALVAFRYIDGFYHLSDDWTPIKIARRMDEQLTLSESRQLIEDIQAHLLLVLANEHPSVIDSKSFYNPNKG